MAERPEFQQKQYAFAAHIRDPDGVDAPPGVEDRRMAIYRELFFNNLRSLLSNMFPVLKKLHDPEHWQRIIRQFMQRHRAKTPYFLQLPREFLAFLQDEYEARDDDFPFLLELAHYEYIELALSISEQVNDVDELDADGDLLRDTPVKSALAWMYAYEYPVHRINQDFVPAEPGEQPTFLAVYRDAGDKVGFLELNAVTAGLLEALDANDSRQSGESLLRALAHQIQYSDTEALIRHGAEALQQMRQLDIVIGTIPSIEGAR